MSPTPEQVAAAVRAYVDSFNRSDRAAFLGALAPGIVQTDPVGTPPRVGLEAVAAFWDGLYAQVERVELTERDLIVSGPAAALTFHLVQHTADARIDVDGIDVFVVDEDGRIAAVSGYSDAAHVSTGPATRVPAG